MIFISNKQTPVIRDTHFKSPNKRWQGSLVPWLMTGALATLPLHTSADEEELILKDFSDVSYFSVNGHTKTVKTSDGVVLRLTPAKKSQSGSVFGTKKASTANFSTHFTFRVTEPGGYLSGGDGFVFVVQPISSSATSEGGGLGYAGIEKSIGVEFDTWDNSKEKDDTRNDKNDNHVGININGGFNGPTAAVSPAFENGEIWHAWIDYDGNQLEVRTNTTGKRPLEALLTRKLDISKIMGGIPRAFIGFTSATGGAFANYDILSFRYNEQYAPVGADHVDVWMADSKGDKGVEPNKVSRRFWLSPDIWIRNKEDGVERYQNVEAGQDNYIYVRARNRGTATANNTTIEVYRSIPSMGNRWPKSWDFVGKTNIATIEPNATQKVAIRWDKKDIPKPGHYCFYVRVLNEDDPMKSSERVDSLANMRNNNGVVSRNFNVVDLLKDVSDEFEVAVHNTKDEPANIDLVFEEEEKLLENDGTGFTVNLGSLYSSWQATGAKGVNVKPAGGTTVQVLKTPAKINGISMKPAESQTISMKVAASKPMPGKGTERTYQFSTQEWVDGKLVGGVDYAMTTRAQDTDTDGDGIKDVIDTDDDNDCRSDDWELKAGLNPLDASDGAVASTVPFDTIPASAKKTVDFENMPGINQIPGMEITNQFEKSHGITINSPTTKVTLIKVGEKPVGFVSVYDANGKKTRRENKRNRPAPDANIGQYLVMAKDAKGADLTITYQQPVAQAGGDVIDVDGQENLMIIAKNGDGKEVSRAHITKKSPNSGDGRATHWSFDVGSPVIKTVDIIQRGKGLGVAFDNFSASPICRQPQTPRMVTGSRATRPTITPAPSGGIVPTPTPSGGIVPAPTPSGGIVPTPTPSECIMPTPSPTGGITPTPNVEEATVHFNCKMADPRAIPAGNICFKMTPDAGSKDTTGLTMVPTTGTRVALTEDQPRYTDNGDATVTDNKTGLVWLQNANCIGTQYPDFLEDCCSPKDGKVNWKKAHAFVDGLNTGKFPKCDANHTDWRLPTVQEMQGLVHYGFDNPAMSNAAGTGIWQEKDAFSNVKTDSYWTSTLDASTSNFAWRLRFDRGLLFTEHKSLPFYVWPVRGGECQCKCPPISK